MAKSQANDICTNLKTVSPKVLGLFKEVASKMIEELAQKKPCKELLLLCVTKLQSINKEVFFVDLMDLSLIRLGVLHLSTL